MIEAAEAEEAAFRQLRDRWQTNNLSLFEALELQRSNRGPSPKMKWRTLATELEGELEEAADPEDTQGQGRVLSRRLTRLERTGKRSTRNMPSCWTMRED